MPLPRTNAAGKQLTRREQLELWRQQKQGVQPNANLLTKASTKTTTKLNGSKSLSVRQSTKESGTNAPPLQETTNNILNVDVSTRSTGRTLCSPPGKDALKSNMPSQTRASEVLKRNSHLEQTYASSPLAATHNDLKRRLQRSAKKRAVLKADNRTALEIARDEAKRRRQMQLSSVKRKPGVEQRAREAKLRVLSSLVTDQVAVAKELAENGKVEEALEFMQLLRREVQGAEKFSLYWSALSNIYVASNRFGTASEILREGLEMTEVLDGSFHQNLRDALDKVQKQRQESFECCEEPMLQSPDNPVDTASSPNQAAVGSNSLVNDFGDTKPEICDKSPCTRSATQVAHTSVPERRKLMFEDDLPEEAAQYGTHDEEVSTKTAENRKLQFDEVNCKAQVTRATSLCGGARRVAVKSSRDKDKKVLSLFSAAKPKRSTKIEEAEQGSIRTLDIVRTSRSEKEHIGSERAATPVRRSARNSARKAPRSRAEILEDAEYAYQPNPNLSGWREGN